MGGGVRPPRLSARLAPEEHHGQGPDPSGSVVSVRALLLGERIDLKGLEAAQCLATNPLLVPAGESQYAALFRYGAVVLFGVNPLQEVTFVDQLARLVGQPYPKRETEEARLRVDPAGEDRVEGGEILLHEVTVESLQVIADVMAKSVVLGYYEASLAGSSTPSSRSPRGLREGAAPRRRNKDLLRFVGDTLLTQHKMVGRVEVGEKPDVLWELPGLSRLFSRLEDEYEVAERRLALDRKLDLISRTVETLVDLPPEQARPASRVVHRGADRDRDLPDPLPAVRGRALAPQCVERRRGASDAAGVPNRWRVRDLPRPLNPLSRARDNAGVGRCSSVATPAARRVARTARR